MTFHAEVLDGRIITSIVAEQPRITSAAPKTGSYDDDNDNDEDEDEDGEHEENEHEEEGEDDDD
jgi:ribosomal protein L12E/L44/L45/RPP1/RPP2